MNDTDLPFLEPFTRPVEVNRHGDVWETPEETAERLHYEEYVENQTKSLEGRKEAERRVDAAEDGKLVYRLKALSEVQEQGTDWLWENRIPLGDFTIVGGRAGIGKSLFLCTLVAWITTGDCRGYFDGQPRNVIFVANEDSYRRAVVPRLKAAGADLSRVFTMNVERDGEGEVLMLPRDLQRMRRAVADVDAVAVILDPVSSNMGDRDRNSPEVRKSYERLRTFAETANVAVVGNGHLKKGAFADFLEGFMGSSEIGNIARAAIGIALNPDSEERTVVLSQCKNNNGPMNLKSYTYQVVTTQYEAADGTLISAPKLAWGDSTTDLHVNDIFSEPVALDSKSDVQECREWLSEYLMRSPGTPRQQVIGDAKKAGFKEHTVKRAAKAVAHPVNAGTFPRQVLWEPKPRARYINGQSEQ